MRKALLLLVPALVMSAQQLAPNPHMVDATAARAMIKAWQDQKASSTASLTATAAPNAIKFNAQAVQMLLAQKGAVGIAWYFALNNGHITLVGFAYDAAGQELPMAIENGLPCPPYC